MAMPPIIGHDAILRELRALAGAEPPPHALLLAGPESTGRMALAREYAKLLNCEQLRGGGSQGGFDLGLAEPGRTDGTPCGACRACRLIADGTHPDVVVLSPGDMLCKPRAGEAHASHPQSRDIRICQVRGTIDLVARFPYEGRFRVVIIEPADRITVDAANTMLKTLEEPPTQSVFVLISAAPENLLETIVSRCRRIDVRPVATWIIEAGLAAQGIDPATAKAAAAAARGRPGLAIAYAAKPDLMGDRERLLKRCARVAASPLQERLRYADELSTRWRGDKDRAGILRELETWEQFWEEDLRRTAAIGDEEGGREAVTALTTVSRAREYLLANCLARTVFDFMLMTFPERRLGEGGEEFAETDD
ncbi:MAG: DNA polymerase III subunit [Thermomicrobiales bacterium]|nr:DNA polymerase III subunit [Thermomicrobiales bacterium]